MMTAGAVPHLKLMTTQGEGEEGPCPQPQAPAVQLFFIQNFRSSYNDTRCSLQHSPRSPQPQLSGVHLLQFVLLCFICLTCIILPLGELHRDTGYLWYSPKRCRDSNTEMIFRTGMSWATLYIQHSGKVSVASSIGGGLVGWRRFWQKGNYARPGASQPQPPLTWLCSFQSSWLSSQIANLAGEIWSKFIPKIILQFGKSSWLFIMTSFLHYFQE